MKNPVYGASFTHSRLLKTLALAVLIFICLPLTGLAQSPQHITKRYPAGKNVRLELKNVSGTIVVESWERNEVKISANLESPAAHFTPRQLGDDVIIDVMGDNRGRGDVGAVNFKIQLPASSSVDLETRRGDIQVTNIHGRAVRARVSSEGDVNLTGISAEQVEASNTIGEIVFDGEFARGGNYQFTSGQGNITIRIPGDSAFHLVAASQTRKIALNQFWNKGIQLLGSGRKVVCDVGDGRSSVSVTTFNGGITFLRK